MLLIPISVALVALLGTQLLSRGESLPPGAVGDDWSLVFSDDFSEGQLDRQKWTTCYWWDVEGCTNKGNNELEWYRPENVTVTDDMLRLRAERREFTASDDITYPFTSGMVTTGRDTSDTSAPVRFAFTYGYVEFRARVPAGSGLWPALWLLPTTHESEPEIDIMEVDGRNPSISSAHFHYVRDGEDRSKGDDWQEADLSADWHRYAIEWNRDAITWYVDDEERWRFDDTQYIPDEPMYLIANLAVGGDWVGPPDETTEFPAWFDIDYVKVWQRDQDR